MNFLYRLTCCLLTLCFIFANTIPLAAGGSSPAGTELQTNGKAVVLLDAYSGRVLYEHNSHEQLPPASLTKIMTGFLVAEYGNLDEKVTISEHAAETPEELSPYNCVK